MFKSKKTVLFIVLTLFICFTAGCTLSGKSTVLKIEKISNAINPDFNRIKNLSLGDYDSEFVSLLQNFCARSASAIIEESEKNIVISPISYYLTLAMLSEMTNGITFAEILASLEMPSLEYVRTNTKQMYEKLFDITSENEKILLGNSIWIDDQFSVKEDLLNDLAEYYYTLSYNGDLQSLDTAAKIKKWIDSMTGNLIKSVPEDFLGDDSAVFMLFNTIYFENSWFKPFDKTTKKGDFYLSSGESVRVDFMNCSDAETAFLSPRFTSYHKAFNQGYSMQFVLPNENESPFDLVNDLEILKEILTLSLYNKKADVTITIACSVIPKFAYRFDCDLISASQKMGINDIFNQANRGFTKVNERIPVYVSGYNQKAYVELDQNGVKAAAVTQVTGEITSVNPVQPITIQFDRPFLYVIYDKEHIPLFIGIVNNPSGQ